MCSGKEASNGNMRSAAQVVICKQRGKEVHNGPVPRWRARISRLAKADGKREYLFTDLADICTVALPTETCIHTSVNMRDLPVPELWTTEMALG